MQTTNSSFNLFQLIFFILHRFQNLKFFVLPQRSYIEFLWVRSRCRTACLCFLLPYWPLSRCMVGDDYCSRGLWVGMHQYSVCPCLVVRDMFCYSKSAVFILHCAIQLEEIVHTYCHNTLKKSMGSKNNTGLQWLSMYGPKKYQNILCVPQNKQSHTGLKWWKCENMMTGE